MCGILGGIFTKPIDKDQFGKALDTLYHRGPEASGVWFSGNGTWALGHRRLSIIGLENGQQPFSDTAHDVHVAVNGEFYGYQAIRGKLKAQGYPVQTESDSEIALHLYQRDGMAMLPHMRGEFSILIADHQQKALIGVRDRFGIKPLFYTIHEGNIIFASEIKALIALGVPARWNQQAFFEDSFLTRPHTETLFAGIHAVPPGHYAVARDGAVKTYPYWAQTFPTADALATDNRTEEEMVQGFRDVLDDAIKERLIADVEVASYLSGGIDSCAVLGLAQKQASRPIKAYTLAFEHELYDESPIAEQQAAFVGADYHRIPVTPQQMADAYADAVWHAETPLINSNSVAKFLLSREVRDAGIKVVFTGEGADEMLGGYLPFRRDMLLFHSGTQHDLPAPEPLLASVHQKLGWVPSWIELATGPGKETAALFRQDYLTGLTSLDPYEKLMTSLPMDQLAGRDALNQSLYLFGITQLPNFMLTILGDRMEMAHSLEARVPFLDHKVADYAAHLPVHMKIKDLKEKYILREAARDVIIEPVYNREKQTFTAPPVKNVGDPVVQLFKDVFASKALDEQPFYDPAKARAMLMEMETCAPDRRLMLDCFAQRILSTVLIHTQFNMTA